MTKSAVHKNQNVQNEQTEFSSFRYSQFQFNLKGFASLKPRMKTDKTKLALHLNSQIAFCGILIKTAFPLYLMLCFLNCSVAQNSNLTVADYAKQHIAIAESNSFDADRLMKEALDCYLDKKYQSSKEKYLRAISILSNENSNTNDSQEKISTIREALANVYTAWAQDILQESQGKAIAGKADEALQLCNQAKEMNPACKDIANKLIQKYSDIKNNSQYKESISNENVNPSYKDKLYKVDVLYEQGKALFNKKLYNQAKDKFQELLLIDPYNVNAIEYIRQINGLILKAGDYRTKVTSTERKAEIEWEKLSPIISKTLSGDRVDLMENQPIKKNDDELSSIKEKLDKIIIKNINFEEVPIDTAMLFLKTESQKIDPSGKGFNFFLRIEPQEQPAQTQTQDNNKQDQSWDQQQQQKEKINPANQYIVTIVLDNVSLGKAIDYICKSAGLKYKINKYAIEIFSPNVQFDDFDTQVIPVEKEIFDQAKNETTDLKDYFTERGVNFGEGATAVYDPKISRLVVRNSQYEIQKIKKILDEIEKRLPQVSIAAKFVEMEQTDFDELGFEWKTSRIGGPNANWDKNDAINRFASDKGVINTDGTPDREFGFLYQNDGPIGGFQLESTMHALQQNKRTEILSAPKVTTLSGHKAVIRLVTDEVFPTGWNAGTQTTLSSSGATGAASIATIGANPIINVNNTTPIGIMLTVLPIVSTDNYTIDLSLEPVVQDLQGWTNYSTPEALDPQSLYQGVKMPEITARIIQTDVRVFDGETVAMGGVFKDDTKKINDSIPILGNIPLVGRLFQSEIENAVKTNLLVFTTVQLIRPDGTPLRPSKYNGLPTFRE